MNAPAVSNKEIVRDLLSRLPEQISLKDIAREIEFIAAVREGLTELDAGQSIAIDDVERDLRTWLVQ
ncbi:hypothetical protein [uncultured Nevskia sp.]|uniref:hypothetical protein n=1 Tax=uncultured Nevskia sp. TaxID=228950 RepID=UPI0025CDC7A2|nr:hypothetical protein [uncultured Nevskia sp.]